MREKNLIILCIVFAVLISLSFFKESMKPKVSTTEEVSDIIGPSVTSDTVNGIIIRIGSGESDDPEKPRNVHLAKEGDHWVVKTSFGVYGRDQIIDPFLEKLDSLEGELRSNNDEILGDYGIDDEQAVHIQLQRPDADPLDIAVGIVKAGNQNSFIRMGGTSAVSVVEENLLATLGVRGEGEDQKLDKNKWIDKRISHLDAGDVVGVTITERVDNKDITAIDIKREEVDGKKQWKSSTAYDFGISASKIKSMIETFNNTYAQDVLAPDEEGVFDVPGWTGVFTLTSGEQVKIVRGDEKPSGKYYLKQEGAGYHFHIATSTFNSRKNQQGKIFANNPLKADEKNISEIEIRDLINEKDFHAIKKPAEEVEGEGSDDAADKKEDVWESPSGDAVDTAKVRDIVNKIKVIAIEAALKPDSSLDNAMVIRIVKDGTSAEYSITKDHKSDTNKECQFLSVDGGSQSYCVSKSHIDAIQKILP